MGLSVISEIINNAYVVELCNELDCPLFRVLVDSSDAAYVVCSNEWQSLGLLVWRKALIKSRRVLYLF